MPKVVLESYVPGVSVVATVAGETPEVAADGVDGYLKPAGDPTAMGGPTLDVLADDKRDVTGLRERRRICTEFTFDAQVCRLLGVCEELLNCRREGVMIDDLVPNSEQAR